MDNSNPFSRMVVIQQATAYSTVPALEGDSNIEAWKDALWNELKTFEVIEFIQSEVPEPAEDAAKADWRIKRQFVNNILHKSLQKVASDLKAAGW